MKNVIIKLTVLITLTLWSVSLFAGPTTAFNRIAQASDTAATKSVQNSQSVSRVSSTAPKTSAPSTPPTKAVTPIPPKPLPQSFSNGRNNVSGVGLASRSGEQSKVTRKPRATHAEQAPKPREQIKPDAIKPKAAEVKGVKKNVEQAKAVQKQASIPAKSSSHASTRANGAAVDKVRNVNLEKVDARTKSETLATKKKLQDDMATQKRRSNDEINQNRLNEKKQQELAAQKEENFVDRKRQQTTQLNEKKIADAERQQVAASNNAREVTGRGKNRLKAHPDAVGEHTVFQRGNDGKVFKYKTYERTKTGNMNPVKRYDGGNPDGSPGAPHWNKITGESVPTPHVQGKNIPGGVRSANLDEIPR